MNSQTEKVTVDIPLELYDFMNEIIIKGKQKEELSCRGRRINRVILFSSMLARLKEMEKNGSIDQELKESVAILRAMQPMTTKTRKPFAERIQAGLKESLTHAKGELL